MASVGVVQIHCFLAFWNVQRFSAIPAEPKGHQTLSHFSVKGLASETKDSAETHPSQ